MKVDISKFFSNKLSDRFLVDYEPKTGYYQITVLMSSFFNDSIDIFVKFEQDIDGFLRCDVSDDAVLFDSFQKEFGSWGNSYYLQKGVLKALSEKGLKRRTKEYLDDEIYAICKGSDLNDYIWRFVEFSSFLYGLTSFDRDAFDSRGKFC